MSTWWARLSDGAGLRHASDPVATRKSPVFSLCGCVCDGAGYKVRNFVQKFVQTKHCAATKPLKGRS
eukprot:5971372-Prymnesium_polylepis.1